MINMAEKEHCMECAGHAAARGESCNTCDGTGKNVAKAKPVEKETKKKRK